MAFELDHLFICTTTDAPEAEDLIAFGLTEGRSRVHPGQGTANRCFFFHNLMLELLWVHDSQEAQSEVTRPLYLWKRWVDRSRNCPFGICLRPQAEGDDNPGEQPLPFSIWNYQPAYLPSPLTIAIANNIKVLTEPLLFYLSFAKRQDTYPADNIQPLEHAAGFREVTRVELVSPHAQTPSPELQAMVDAGFIELRWGSEYLITLGFDGESVGDQADFRPKLPLLFSW